MRIEDRVDDKDSVRYVEFEIYSIDDGKECFHSESRVQVTTAFREYNGALIAETCNFLDLVSVIKEWHTTKKTLADTMFNLIVPRFDDKEGNAIAIMRGTQGECHE